jgi:hypothetical protein
MLNQKGLAMIEIIPLLVIFILIVNFALGFFGFIHSGILNSIAARNYAFETFRNRADLNYLRDITGSDVVSYRKTGLRYHGISKENASGSQEWQVTERFLRFTDTRANSEIEGREDHDTKVKTISDGSRASERVQGVSPGWVRVIYGICLNAKCTEEGS